MGSGFSDSHIRDLLSGGGNAGGVRLPAAEDAAGPHKKDNGQQPAFSADTQQFFAAWQAWRGSQLLPSRRDVALTGIARLMPQLVVLEVRGPDRAVFRLAGTELESRYGAVLTGRSFLKMTAPEHQQRRGELIWLQVTQPCAAVMHQCFVHRSGRQEEVEIASAPVRPDDPAAPIQLFAVVSRMSRRPWGEIDPVTRNFGRKLQFLDIGAGLPAHP